VAISIGREHSCALIGDGTVRCWGWNAYGQLGDGTPGTYSASAVSASGIVDAVSVSAGYGHSCAALSDGSARCWGWNLHGQLGDGTNVDRVTPVRVAPPAGVTRIAAGNIHTCAQLEDGAVRCWGSNRYGELGDGSAWRTRAVRVTGT
jgi:alpha-tubulin suppressor-like RCC1 family protein